MAAKHFDVLSPLAFLEDIEHEAKSAKKRIWAQAMEVEPGEIASRLLNLVEEAGKIGFDARLNIDYYSLMVTDGLPNFPLVLISGKWRKRLQAKKEVFARIEDNNTKISYINSPTLLEKFVYTMGRNHMKIFIVDNIAWIGGVNFADGYFKRQDIMVKITDKAIVGQVALVFMEAHEERLKEDEVLKTNNAALFIDSGRTGKSVILDEAVRMIDMAKQTVRVVTAFVPDGKFLSALIAADRRGVMVELAVSDPSATLGVFQLVNYFSDIQLKLKHVNFKILYQKLPVHAKVIIVDKCIAFFGSHNFLTKGVMMRTAEIALQSEDKRLISNLLDFYQTINH